MAALATVRSRFSTVTALAITPTVLFASGIALQHARAASDPWQVAGWATVAALPVLTGLAAVIVIALALEGLVLRWLVYLERLARAYARGRYSVRPIRLLDAPSEFRALGLAVTNMAVAVEDRDHALRAALDEQSVLLREVHHRVKNNLQIVGSLLSLQAARSGDEGVKVALLEALVRLDAIALSQRFMQPNEDEDTISTGDLFNAFAAQIRARLGTGPRRLHLQLEIDDVVVKLELGGRLVMIAAEALLQAYSRPIDDPLSARLILSAEGESVSLKVVAAGDPAAFDSTANGVFSALMDGYARQARGALARPESRDGVVSVSAPV